MTYIIAEPCIDVKDKSCVDVCPVDCIHPTDGEGEPMLYIDPDECIDCGACEPECPVEAIFAEEDLPEEWSRFTEINAKYFELKDSPEEWSRYKEDQVADLEKKSENKV
jgi:NAD-dependent dihydropyrimidine dehydrogenase PreA subunit